jgi:serine protease Do
MTMDLIQTDCAINSGNSGGALFNTYGEVVGITNAKYSTSSSSSSASIDNIGFAIPINSVLNIVDSIIENGYISKPYIGITVQTVSTETQAYGLPQGAAVKTVVEDSTAEQAGLQANDIITEVNGQTITSSSDLVNLIADCNIGDELNMTIYRQGETLQLTVPVGEKIQSALAEETDQSTSSSSSSSSQQYQFSFPGGSFFSFGK